MAISRVSVQRAESAGYASSVQTSAQSHTLGNLLVVLISRQSGTGVTVTDTANNTYRHVGTSYIWPNVNIMSIYICPNATGHASNQVTVTLATGSAQYFMVSVMEFSGNFGNNPAYFPSTFYWSSGTTMTNPWASSSVNVGLIEADGQSISAGAGGATVGGFTSGYFADAYKTESTAAAFYGSCSGSNECYAVALFETYQMQQKNPSSYSTEDINSTNWVNPGAGTGAYDDVYYPYINNQGDYLLLTNFGFSVPTGSVIVAVASSVYGRAGAGGCQTGMQIIKGGTRTANWLSTVDLTVTSWYGYYTLGGYTALSTWGSLTLSVADVNASNFGVALREIAGGTFMGIAATDVAVFYLEPGSAVTQTKYPSAAANNSGNSGNFDWTGITNVYTENDSGAAEYVTDSYYFRFAYCYTYGFAIPAGCTINGIKVEARIRNLAGGCKDGVIKLFKVGSAVGNDLKDTASWGGSYAYKTWGGASELWGTTWTDSDINDSGFGAGVSAQPTGAGNYWPFIDTVRITVYYSVPGLGGQPKVIGGKLTNGGILLGGALVR